MISTEECLDILKTSKEGGRPIKFGNSLLGCGVVSGYVDFMDCIGLMFEGSHEIFYLRKAGIGNGWGDGREILIDYICFADSEESGKPITKKRRISDII